MFDFLWTRVYGNNIPQKEAIFRLVDIEEVAAIPPDRNDDIIVVYKRSHGKGVLERAAFYILHRLFVIS